MITLGSREVKANRDYSIYGIDIDHKGRIYVGNFRHNALLIYDENLNEITQVNVPTPHGVAVDQDGFIYVATYRSGRIFKFDVQGREIAGWDASLKKQDKIKKPIAVDVDDDNNLIIADYELGQLLRADKDGKFLLEFDTKNFKGEEKFLPHGMATDGKEYVYVAVRGAYAGVHVFTLNGQYVKRWKPLNEPYDLLTVRFLNEKFLLTPNYKNSMLHLFNLQGEHLACFGPSGDKTEKFLSVMDVAADPHGFCYAVEQDSNRIQKIDLRDVIARYRTP